MQITPKTKSLGAAGGASATAKSGSGYNQGGSFAASTGGEKPGSHKDLRGGNASSASGYNQGSMFAAQAGGEKPGTQKDLRGGNANPNTGFNQGNQFGANKK